MNKRSKSFQLLFLGLACLLQSCNASSRSETTEIVENEVVYKTVGDTELKLHVFQCDQSGRRPAIVFFFGGGWVGGSVNQFFPHCEHFASKGMVAISAEYRIKSKHGTTPFECVADGKSAIRYVRIHAEELGIDPRKIVASGGSAGGHVAACTGVIEGFDEEGDDTAVSSKPNAMVLFNPVIDTTERGYGAEKLKGQEKTLSPAHHVVTGIAPTIIFHGTADTTVPFENVERFCRKMNEAGNECRLVPYEGMKHGFFNYTKEKDHKSFNDTIRRTEEFLRKLGYFK